jgi:hypothetical protein
MNIWDPSTGTVFIACENRHRAAGYMGALVSKWDETLTACRFEG